MEENEKIPQEILDNWADCPVTGCPNKCCLRLNSKYCFPHTMSGKSLEEVIAEKKCLILTK